MQQKSADPPLVVRMTGLFVVAMNVLTAARKPESSSKMTSTSSNRMSEVAVFLLCSSLLFSLGEDAAGELTDGALLLLCSSLPFEADLDAAARGGNSEETIQFQVKQTLKKGDAETEGFSHLFACS